MCIYYINSLQLLVYAMSLQLQIFPRITVQCTVHHTLFLSSVEHRVLCGCKKKVFCHFLARQTCEKYEDSSPEPHLMCT